MNKSEKDKYYMLSLLYGIKTIIQVNVYAKQNQTHRERTCGYQRKEESGEERSRMIEVVNVRFIQRRLEI